MTLQSCIPSLGFNVSGIVRRDYGQTEIFLVDDDGYDRCFGVDSNADSSLE